MDLQSPNARDYEFGPNPWTDPQSYRDQIDYFENVALHYRREARKAKWLGRFGFANRAGRQSPNQSSLFRRFARPSTIAWGDVLFGAACGLVAGMLGTVGLAYVIAWVAL